MEVQRYASDLLRIDTGFEKPQERPRILPYLVKSMLTTSRSSDFSKPRFGLESRTWEEKNLNTWATGRIKELLATLDSLEFAGGRAGISEVSNCKGDRWNWLVEEEKADVKGYIDIHEFSLGELG